ncbi:hypothetical protein L228DRAFT_173885 [Xylona heveae TC161]|uniref:Uncharacterized protein n=1 Tax=Xylona heveae (strain CBS 132557 / TC161) TaxID=1328760 RepID=A0A165AIZ8_XYLHT|nr:hypothetical protein L228DRAFT_173885 [Xylona heveae TC161]KZF20560.1 hypothetical protein L228DRAFT_173885 [Xylona heveae TC161]
MLIALTGMNPLPCPRWVGSQLLLRNPRVRSMPLWPFPLCARRVEVPLTSYSVWPLAPRLVPARLNLKLLPVMVIAMTALAPIPLAAPARGFSIWNSTLMSAPSPLVLRLLPPDHPLRPRSALLLLLAALPSLLTLPALIPRPAPSPALTRHLDLPSRPAALRRTNTTSQVRRAIKTHAATCLPRTTTAVLSIPLPRWPSSLKMNVPRKRAGTIARLSPLPASSVKLPSTMKRRRKKTTVMIRVSRPSFLDVPIPSALSSRDTVSY